MPEKKFIQFLILSIILSLLVNLSNSQIPKDVTVHVVPHTHDDVGWLKTYDDYFTGQQGGVAIT